MRAARSSRLWPVLGSCVLLFLLGYSPWGLWERDEGRYADVAREMLARRDFITPRIDGAVFLDKPPLVYWVTAASLWLWGHGETGARFGQILFGAGTLLITRRIGILLFERRRANIALLILASTVGFFSACHLLTLDLGLTFFVSLAMLFFLKANRAGPHGSRWYFAMSAALAGGVLAKGPIGALLPAMSIACFLTLRQEGWRLLQQVPWARCALLFCGIVAPWFLAVSIVNPDFPKYFFVHEHLARFATTEHRHTGAWYYYLAVGAAALLPWSLLVPLRLLRRPGRLFPKPTWPVPEAPAFLWSWILPGFLFFTAARSKLPLYILPLFPAAALLLAAMVERDAREDSSRAVRLWPLMFLVFASAVAAALWRHHGEWMFMGRAGIGVPLALLLTLLTAGALAAASILARRGRHFAGLAVVALLWMSAIYVMFTVVGRVNFFNQTRHFANVLARERRDGEPVFAYNCFLRGLPFYLRQTVGLVSPHSDDLRYGREHGHDPDTFPEEETLLKLLEGEGRVFAVVRPGDLGVLQEKVGRPLFILARSDSHELVSNRLGAEQGRALARVLSSTMFDLEGALARAARVRPGAVLETVEIETIGGEPICTMRMSLAGSGFEINIPMARPAQLTVGQDDPAGEESGEEDHLLRLSPPAGAGADIPHLIREAAGK